jgi:hypothetical protein
MENLKQRWNLKSNWQVLTIILVFAITGSTAALISKPILQELGISKEAFPIFLYFLLYFVILFPIYQVLLVSIGYIFGQFQFFWNIEKKVLRALKLGFIIQLFEKKKGAK